MTVTKKKRMKKAILEKWDVFGKGFLIRVTSPMIVGFIAILALFGGVRAAVPFAMVIGVLGGMRALRLKMRKDLEGAE